MSAWSLLNKRQRATIEGLEALARGLTAEDLSARIQTHLARAAATFASNPMLNLKLVRGLVGAFEQALGTWDRLSARNRRVLATAVLYFVSDRDEEPDFESAIGFEDDAEVLNACLRHIGREDLTVRIEDFDGG